MVKGISRNMSLEGKTKTLLVRLSFFVHFFAVLHDYDVNLPNFTLYTARKQATTKFHFSF